MSTMPCKAMAHSPKSSLAHPHPPPRRSFAKSEPQGLIFCWDDPQPPPSFAHHLIPTSLHPNSTFPYQIGPPPNALTAPPAIRSQKPSHERSVFARVPPTSILHALLDSRIPASKFHITPPKYVPPNTLTSHPAICLRK